MNDMPPPRGFAVGRSGIPRPMIKKRTILAFGLGAAAAWYADPVSGPGRRETLRRQIDAVSERGEALREHLPHRDVPEPLAPRPPSSAATGATSLDEVEDEIARRLAEPTDAEMAPVP